VPGEFIVTDTNQIHEARCTHTYMMIVLRYDDDLIQRLMGNKRNFQIICSRAELTDELVPAYLEICECLKKLAPLHVKQPKGYLIAEQSIALDILYRLIKDFSIPLYKEDLPEPSRNQLRIKEIVSYIDKHYMESLSLEQIADVFGLNSDYFSRMFRQNIGIPFTQHVNHVRLTHIYHDICTTDEPVLEILDKHGFTNYKLFSRMFKEMYGDTPREIRRRARLEQMA
jgi:AraC-like DNA-binding protein